MTRPIRTIDISFTDSNPILSILHTPVHSVEYEDEYDYEYDFVGAEGENIFGPNI